MSESENQACQDHTQPWLHRAPEEHFFTDARAHGEDYGRTEGQSP